MSASQTTIAVRDAPAPTLPEALHRHELELSKGRRLLTIREKGAWRVAVRKRQTFAPFGWSWEEGIAPTLARALEEAFGLHSSTPEVRQVERYLLDTVYVDEILAARPRPREYPFGHDY